MLLAFGDAIEEKCSDPKQLGNKPIRKLCAKYGERYEILRNIEYNCPGRSRALVPLLVRALNDIVGTTRLPVPDYDLGDYNEKGEMINEKKKKRSATDSADSSSKKSKTLTFTSNIEAINAVAVPPLDITNSASWTWFQDYALLREQAIEILKKLDDKMATRP